ncbi:MAG: DUF3108 domain-containing protein [Candidatus Kapabacteria bacterium]|nr:DUF3108 domain-containing protein [Ignavibacteriota bacterium]MCW5885047.1 DUF3108 domain-containing protein [Candidatus Kapabacteria bacterium]
MEISKKILFLSLSVVIFVLTLLLTMTLESQDDVSKKTFRYVPNEAFGFGEKLNYSVGYKFITAGTGHFHIQPEPVYRNGRKCYDVRFMVKSLESLDWLYMVRDQYRTILDVNGIFPWEFEQKIREGGYKRDAKAYFDQANNTAKTNKKTIFTPEYVHDIVSAFFYVRTLDIGNFPKDSTFFMPNFVDDTTYTLGVKIRGKQTVKVDAGEFNCIVIEPLVVQGGLFKADGTILVWVSDDERKIPVKVATKIPIGYVEAKLTSYSGLRGKLDSKIN